MREGALTGFPAVTGALLSLALLAAPAAGQSNAPPDPTKIQTLILTGRHVGEHQWWTTSELMRDILHETGRFEVRINEEVRGIGPETLAPYDLVIVNYYNRTPEDRWGERAEKALEDFVRAGKGLVLYHATLAAFNGWGEFEKMSGGNWRPNEGHHSAPHDFTVDIKDPAHPVTRGLRSSFEIYKDELYANLRWQPEGTYHVLATAWDDHVLYGGKAQQPIPGPGLHQPILWTTDYGAGRVFITALGHFPDAVKNRGFVVTFARGAEWAATGDVTLPVPPDMAAPAGR